MIPSDPRRTRRRRRPLVVVAVALAGVAGAACGGGGAAPTAERADAIDADDSGDSGDTGDSGDSGDADVTPTIPDTAGGDPLPGLTAAAEDLIVSATYVDGCPLFTDVAALVAPYGEVTSGSSGPDTTTIGGVEVPEVYCNVGTSGGLASFFLVVVDADAATILDAGLADPNVASGTITPAPTSPSAVVGGTVAGACIEGAEVSDQCRYVWSNGRVALGYADLTGIDPATAAAVLELAVVDLQLTIV